MLIALMLALLLDDPAPTSADPPPTPPPAVSVVATPAESAQVPVTGVVPRLVIPPQTFAPDPPSDLRFVWRNHPSLRASNWFRLDFIAKFQLDTRDPGDDPDDFNTVEVHRMRIGADGELFNHIQFSIERELTENELENTDTDPGDDEKRLKSAWKDVYVEANYSRKAQIRGGQFKIPYGLDQTSGETEQDFVYRSLGGRYLSPGRDTGGMIHGRFHDRRLNYWAGVFKQDGDNSRSKKIEGADTTVAVRVTAQPVRRDLPKFGELEIGGSYAWSDLSNESTLPNGLRGRTVMSQYTYFDSVFVDGRRLRLGIDADWASGPLGGRAEYMYVSDTRNNQGIGEDDLNPARGRAWYVLGTWVLTGEAKKRPVEPKNGGLFRGGVGAVEVAARYDRLLFDSKQGTEEPFRNPRAETIFPNADDVTTLGINYYVNRWIKVQFNTIREHVEDIERSPIAEDVPFWSQVLRLQLEL